MGNKSSKDDDRRLLFGQALAEAIRARGMKQGELARSLGTTQSSVSGWINGKYEPAAATVFAVEQSLRLAPGSLSRSLGYLPVDPAARSVSVEAAIAQSTNLDDDARTALAAMYRVLSRRVTPTTARDRLRSRAPGPRGEGTPAPGGTSGPRSVAGGRRP